MIQGLSAVSWTLRILTIQINQKIQEIGISNVCITISNKIELLNWLSNYRELDAVNRRHFKNFINSIPIIHINSSVSKLAEEIVNKNINSKPADTFIAATAIHYKIPLFTLNVKDFKTIKGIDLF